MVKKQQTTLPSLEDLTQIREKIKNIPNKRGEFKRKVHYGCYLLCSQAGLRISEAVKFDLSAKSKKGLYRISKCKGNKTRYVYVPEEVIKELKANNWQPNQTNRFAFYHFLRKIKQETNISKNIELSPHTFRRAFATYHANLGMPLPILQKLLGHSSIRTTALYWQNIYGDDDPSDILMGKEWLEDKEKEPPQPPSENFALPENTKPETPTPQPTIKPNPPPITTEPPTTAIKTESQPLITKTPIQATEQSSPNTIIKAKVPMENSEQCPVTTNQKEQPNKREQILLEKISGLEKQLAKVQNENNNLKELVQQEKQRADNYRQQLKTVAKVLYQWQKINYYHQLEQERKGQEAKVEQTPKKPPWKPNK